MSYRNLPRVPPAEKETASPHALTVEQSERITCFLFQESTVDCYYETRLQVSRSIASTGEEDIVAPWVGVIGSYWNKHSIRTGKLWLICTIIMMAGLGQLYFINQCELLKRDMLRNVLWSPSELQQTYRGTEIGWMSGRFFVVVVIEADGFMNQVGCWPKKSNLF